MKKEKIIVHIVTRLYLGGAQKVVLNVLSYLKEKGEDILLITGMGDELTEEFEKKNIPIYEIKEFDRDLNPFNDALSMIKIAVRLNMLKKEYSKVIVHTHTSKAGLLGRLSSLIAGVNEVYHTAHGWSFYKNQNIILRAIYSISELMASKITKKIVGVSKSVIEEGISIGINKEKFILIYNDIENMEKLNEFQKNIIRERLDIKENEKVVLQVSCLKKQKAPMDFIKIAERFKKEKLKFVLAGDGELRKDIEDYIKLKAINNVILTGWYKNVYKLYNIADVFVLTSIFEGHPLVVLEYKQFNKPIILSDIAPNREIMKENAIFCLVHDVDCFTKKIKTAIKSERRNNSNKKEESKMKKSYENLYSQNANIKL